VVRRWELDAPPPGIYMAAADLDSRVRKLAAAERKREGGENVLRESCSLLLLNYKLL
jgi:3-deoxy-D-manno-octulosonate 8-phosphate phosphatase KdsC-like HAD superfamily phosphatase